jgi:UPF0271 protein
MDDGTLAPRSLPGAVIHDEEVAIRRVIRMVKEGTVVSTSGKVIELKADSICVHGDNPKAIDFVRKIRDTLTAEGVAVVNLDAIL